MTRTRTVALVQMQSVALDAEANASRSAREIHRATAAGASVVILPELVACGYVTDRDRLKDVAESLDSPGPCLTAWAESARCRKTTVIAGFAEAVGDRIYNSVVTIDPRGETVSLYRKLHLFGSERDCFAPGDVGLPVVDIGGVKIGVIVCYDLRFPEVVRILALRGAELVAVPTAWVTGFDKVNLPDGRIGQVEGAIVQANLSQVFIACADQVGSVEEQVFLGRSVGVDPFGDVLVGPGSASLEEILIFSLDADEVERARHRGRGIDPFDNRRTDVYGKLLGYVEQGDPQVKE